MHCLHRGTETGAACSSCHLRLATQPANRCVACQVSFAALLRKCERLQIAVSQKGLAWKALAQPHLPMALLAQRHRHWGCLLVLPHQTSNVSRGSLPGLFHSPAPKMRMSADSSQPEGISLESCCSASSADGPARTEAQTLGLLACLATSNFKRSLGGPCWAPPAALLRKCERLHLARNHIGLAWKAVAQPHLGAFFYHTVNPHKFVFASGGFYA